MQHPLVFGIAGHNYLVLRDQNNDVIKELHGLATDPKTMMWKYVGTRDTDILQVWEFSTTTKYEAEKRLPGIILYQGNQNEVNKLWKDAEGCKEMINKKKISYPPYGITFRGDTENSNSVAYTLALCMGSNLGHLGWLTPGSQHNLLEVK